MPDAINTRKDAGGAGTQTSRPRSRHDKRREISRGLILDAAQKLMLEEGYAAVSSRRVAREAGLKAPLVHYHFPTTDDLLLALFRRAVAVELDKWDSAGEDSLSSIWQAYQNPEHTALALDSGCLRYRTQIAGDELFA